MFKIGDFAKIGQVSVKTLHHYDEIGLLKPIRVDTTTSYRYYTLDQLPRLNRILALKDLGFSLEQIATLLNEHLAAAELRGMLRLKQAELQRQVQAEQGRLNRVEARLKQIEHEEIAPMYDIIVKSVVPQTIVSGRLLVPSSEDMNSYCQALGIEVFQTVERLGIKVTGPMLTLYHDEEAYTGQDQDIHVEMCIVVDPNTRFPNDTRLSMRELAGYDTVASLVHAGAYDGLWQAYAFMLNWIDMNGYRRNGPFRFAYLRTSAEESEAITEVLFPVCSA